MSSYRTVIAFKCPINYDDVTGEAIKYEMKYFPIDLIRSRSVSANSHIVTHPMQNGDTMADHMYRDPVSLSLSGAFALRGRYAKDTSYNYFADYATDDRLTTIEKTFEYIKNNGILSTITTIITEENNSIALNDSNEPVSNRFITRNNMALESISWTEGNDILEFNFTFREIMFIENIEYEFEPYEPDIETSSFIYPAAQTITQALSANNDQFEEMIIKTLYKSGYIDDGWWKNWAGEFFCKGGLTLAVLTGVAVVAGVVAIVGTTGAACASIFPVGTIIAAAIVTTAAIGFGIYAAIKNYDKKKKAKAGFGFIEKNKHKDIDALKNLILNIKNAIDNATSGLTVYQLTNDNGGEYYLTVGGEGYVLTFDKKNNDWSCEVQNVSSGTDAIIFHPFPTCSTSISDINENINMWFRTTTGNYQVYAMNPSLFVDDTQGINLTVDEENAVKEKLTSYSIWVCKGNISTQIEKIKQVIADELSNAGLK